MKKILNLALLMSIMACAFTSCKESISATSVVEYTTHGTNAQLNNLLQTECKNYNNTLKTRSKEASLKEFDNLVKKLENEILNNKDNKYTIYKDTEIKLSLTWSSEIIKETKLKLEPNVEDIIYLAILINQENESGDIETFTNEYSKKLTEAGMVSADPYKYVYYKEYSTIEDAQADYNAKYNSILNFKGLNSYLRSLNGTGIDYKGKITITYELKDNRQAPTEGVMEILDKGTGYINIKYIQNNNKSANGTIDVSITKE